MSLQVHPDRVAEAEKEEATEKFKVLSKINAVLNDKDKKALYDKHFMIEDDIGSDFDCLKMWREFFEPNTITNIAGYVGMSIGKLLKLNSYYKSTFFLSLCLL